MFPLKYNTASQEVPLGRFLDSTDGDTEETGLTIANTDIKLWKSGATTLASKNSGGATHIANGVYYATLDATDTNTYGPMKVLVHVSGALDIELPCMVMNADAYDALLAANGTGNIESNVVEWAGTATTLGNGAPDVNIQSTDDIDLSATQKTSVNTEADTALSDMFTSSAQLVDDVWDEVLTGGAHNVTNSAGKRLRTMAELVTEEGAVNDASATTLSFISNLTEATSSFYSDLSLVFTSGNLQGQARVITDYNGSTKAITVDEEWTEAPADTDAFNVYALHLHSTGQIADSIWDEATTGHTTAGTFGEQCKTDIDAILVDTGTTLDGKVNTIDTNVDSILVDTAEIGTAGAGLTDLGGMSTAMKAEVLAEAVKLLTTQMTEAYAADGVAPTLTQALMLVQQVLTEMSIASTTATIKKLDGSTTAAELTINDDTDPTSITRAT